MNEMKYRLYFFMNTEENLSTIMISLSLIVGSIDGPEH